MPHMTKKKPKPVNTTQERTQDRHTNPRVVFHLPQWLLDVLDDEANENDRTRTAELIRILKGHFRNIGKLPNEGGGK
jgi:hypothetical protein